MITIRSLLPESFTASWIESYSHFFAKRWFSFFNLRAFLRFRRRLSSLGRTLKPLRPLRIACFARLRESSWHTIRVSPTCLRFSAEPRVRYFGTSPPAAGVTLRSGAGLGQKVLRSTCASDAAGEARTTIPTAPASATPARDLALRSLDMKIPCPCVVPERLPGWRGSLPEGGSQALIARMAASTSNLIRADDRSHGERGRPPARLRLAGDRLRVRRQRGGAAPGREGLPGRRARMRSALRGLGLRALGVEPASLLLGAATRPAGNLPADCVQGRLHRLRVRGRRRQPRLREHPLPRASGVLPRPAVGRAGRLGAGAGAVLRHGGAH